MISQTNQSFEPWRAELSQTILAIDGYRALAGVSFPRAVRFRASKFQSEGSVYEHRYEMNDSLNVPNNALEGRRLLVTPAAYAAVAPSNRLPQLGR
jgi:uncharacterized membrane-anchored protein